ncbi:GreA/GreB family elongation factor [Gilvimarinus sp. 1_MG-2023]|uniref:GreA/GreB family elongation factor n=1 Tax=Gilvimarinus sp. 1_MG-2023 TaxID=3062638 RepID=UPI003FA55A65
MLSAIFNHIESTDVQPTTGESRISINSSVILQDVQERQNIKFTIVSPPLSNPNQGRISFLSPLGAELIGKKKGDTIEIGYLNTILQFRVLDLLQ